MPKKIPQQLETHGHVRVDDYFWMNDRSDPDVIEFLESENALADRTMAPQADLQKMLFREIKSRIKEDDQSAPVRHGPYLYYQRYEAGCEYPVYARREGSMENPEQVLLDVNRVAAGHDYFSLSEFEVSPDHRLAAYAVDTTGRRFFTIFVIDLETGQQFGEAVADVTSDFEWANDSRTIFYVAQDRETLRWHRVYRHRLESPGHELVYEEPDETNWLFLSKSLSGKFIYLTSSQTLSNEVRYLSADRPAMSARLFLARESMHEYFVSDGRDRFYVLTNDNARNFRLMQAPLDDHRKDAWTEVLPHREDVLIGDFEVHRDYVVLDVVENGLSQIELLDRRSGALRRIAFDEPVYMSSTVDNYEYASEWIRYGYESLTTPESVYEYRPGTGEHALIWEQPVLGGFDRQNYRSERLFAPARDGTPIPVSIVYRRELKMDGSQPLLQYGYGAYGDSVEPEFDDELLSLLDRGFVYAIAHVRGGSEMGRRWYEDGRQLNKKNSFHDFIDVTRHLLAEGYAAAGHVYAQGGSAGGLLVGAVANMAPELYNGIATRVPFVDVVTTMLDRSIPLTAGEWDEWGNPADKEYYDYILSYSPYDNVRAQDYPNLLVTTGLHDSQVQYWDPAKWVAKLRETRTDDNELLLKTDMQAGHSGKTGRYKSIEDTALCYAFFLGLEGIRE